MSEAPAVATARASARPAGSVSAAMDLGIRSTVIEGVPVLSLDGEADLASLPQLYEQVRRFVSEHRGQQVVVDLDGVGYLDPVTVGVLVGGACRPAPPGARSTSSVPSPSVAAVFTGSGLDAAFALHARWRTPFARAARIGACARRAAPSSVVAGDDGVHAEVGIVRRSSRRAIVILWTSSGPSARRSVRRWAYIEASGKSSLMPPAPWTWMARSMILRATFGAATLMALISTAAALLPTVSISHAVLSVSKRTISSSMRASAIQSMMFDRSAMRRPKVAGERPLAQQLQGPLGGADGAHAVVDPPGPEPRLADREPVALSGDEVGRRHAHVVELELDVPLLVHVAEHREGPLDRQPGRVLGDEDLALLPMGGRLRIGLAHHDEDRAVGCMAPEIHHLRPLRT